MALLFLTDLEQMVVVEKGGIRKILEDYYDFDAMEWKEGEPK